jgi:zinc/manganese transport system substrate-binding protein
MQRTRFWLLLLALTSAGAPGIALATAPLKVASLSTVTSEIAQRVGGDRVAVIGLVKPGIDPHEYEPTPEDLKAMAASDLVIASGKGLEGYLSKLQQSSGTTASLLRVGDALPGLKSIAGSAHGEDPHWWQSIGAVQKAARIVRDRFIELRPADQEVFTRNAAVYGAELEALKKWAEAEIAKIPRDQRKLVTSHDAFQYFAADFGFTIHPIKGILPEDEPSSKSVAELIAIIRQQKVKAIFPESIENPKVIAEITRETGAQIADKLYADGLGDGDAGTYDGMYRHNVRTIVVALGN